MAAPIAFGVYTQAGSPDATATPSFVAFVTRAGVARDRPGGGAGTILNLGGGQFGAVPSDNDETTGVIYVIDCGAGKLPRYVYGQVCTAANEFLAIVVFNESDALSSGLPTVAVYKDIAGNNRTAPTMTAAGALAYLYSISPSEEDLEIGVSGRVDLPANKLPASIDFAFFARDVPGEASDPPTVTEVSNPGTDPFAPLVVEVEDDVSLRQVILLVRFDGLTRADAIYGPGVLDGNEGPAFGADYSSSIFENIPSGSRFTIYRNGGWPLGRTAVLNVIPVDSHGNEAE